MFYNRTPQLMDAKDTEKMREAGALAATMLKELGAMVEPGITTNDLDAYAVRFAKEHNAINAPLNYSGFPKSICTSVNEIVCHGIPDDKTRLKEGDIIKIDVTLIVDGFHGDTCATYFVGEVSEEARRLTQITANSLRKALDVVRIGGRIGDIGHTIQTYVEPLGYSVVREFQGHGIGRVFHCGPDVPHVGRKNTGQRMRRGMSFTIEPMVNMGHWRTKILEDGWTAPTYDGSLSAQFEHTMIVGPEGPIITTVAPGDDWRVTSPGGAITYTV